MTHTPGPWSLDSSGCRVSGQAKTRGLVAHVYYKDTLEEREANARLIAAAPEILHMLALVLGRLDMAAYEDGRDNAFPCASYRTDIRELINHIERRP